MVRLITVGKPKKGFVADGIKEFEKRLHPYSVKLEFIREGGIPRSPSLYEETKRKEWHTVVKKIRPAEKIFLWDSRGELWDTDRLVDFLKQNMTHSGKIAMVIGGPLGFPEEAYKEADYIVSLSRFTFTHQMAILMVLEQLYRAYKIISGQPYAY
ncbi:23S rRNA (pseudouridine(1915)-N(3))-methyltransferase RlmH [bacterium 3DAC]|jgi:23S rRNA (pseudouridine1915-N3)-methyltransferase|nr:23S rRNA (pseudouridine(1915)-N(3))-methyltransferase RlmH [Dictyoglomota bacterium]UZN22834.1 23S rRNA (pseudouridine(1915)-N(3))-methyltransferase RlmH [bacterium 3DAC]